MTLRPVARRGATVGAHYCSLYPNPYRDPVGHLLLTLHVGGVCLCYRGGVR
jgi:hypothetical protein